MNNFVTPDFLPAAPEVFLLVMACAILLIDLVLGQTQRWITAALTYVALAGCALITWWTANGQVVLTFSNMFFDDPLSDVLKMLVYASVITTLVYSRGYLRDRGLDKGEFYLLVLFATLGMMVMISAAHLLTLYLGLELMSLSLYALVALDRDSVRATEAAMKYFVLGALASGLLLYGMSMVYGATGTLELGGIAQALYHGVADRRIVLIFGLVFLVGGIAFKLGVVPFHMWLPDVYHGAPTAITLFVSSAPKLAAFAMAMRLLVYGLFDLADQWQIMIMLLAVLSIAIGNLAAIAQTNLKRMLAYSAISHMGFMLLGLMSGVVGGRPDPHMIITAYSSAMYYIVAYVMMSLGAFGAIILLSRAGYEAENLEDFKGLNKRSPWFAAVMAMLMFSMAGVPFFIGFFAKFAVLLSAVRAGYIGIAVIAVLFSLVGAFYYLRVVKLMYFDAPTDAAPIAAGLDMRLLLSANGLAVALLGMFPQGIMALCRETMVHSLL
jgi:NADH-quinone oxidoreductase subunit N